jgi:hypothetical protein
MIDMPSAVAFCSMVGTGALDPGAASPPGGEVGDESEVQAAANSSDDNANLRAQTMR